jgi:RND family efflux transporter MFP subunit
MLLVVAGCRPNKPAQGAMPAPPPPEVTVAHPIEQEVMEWDEYTGNLDAVEAVNLRSRVSGMIVAMPFEEGALVKQGDVLVEIDERPFQAELDAKTAELARAAAQVRLTEIDFNRIKGLSAGAVSSTEYDTSEATLRQAQAAEAAAQAAVAAAQLNVEWCKVIAPIAGRISRRYVTPGNLVTGGNDQGTLLTRIASIDPIYCYVDADERSVLKYQRLSREGKRASAREAQLPCYLQLSDEKGFFHEGMIDFVDNWMDPTTGTMRARGIFPNPDAFLVPGFFARVRIPGSGRYRAVLIPDAAVMSDQSQKLVLVVDAEGKVVPRPVKPGALFGTMRAVQEGLTVEDRVIINGMLRARPGTKVTPTEAPLANFTVETPSGPAASPQPSAPPDKPAAGNAP